MVALEKSGPIIQLIHVLLLKHIGALNVYLKTDATNEVIWTLRGNNSGKWLTFKFQNVRTFLFDKRIVNLKVQTGFIELPRSEATLNIRSCLRV